MREGKSLGSIRSGSGSARIGRETQQGLQGQQGQQQQPRRPQSPTAWRAHVDMHVVDVSKRPATTLPPPSERAEALILRGPSHPLLDRSLTPCLTFSSQPAGGRQRPLLSAALRSIGGYFLPWLFRSTDFEPTPRNLRGLGHAFRIFCVARGLVRSSSPKIEWPRKASCSSWTDRSRLSGQRGIQSPLFFGLGPGPDQASS